MAQPSDVPNASVPVPGWYEELGQRPFIARIWCCRATCGMSIPIRRAPGAGAVPERRASGGAVTARCRGLLAYDPVVGVRPCRVAESGLEADLHKAGVLRDGVTDLAQVQAAVAIHPGAPLALAVEYAPHLLRHDQAAADRMLVAVDRAARQRPPARPEGRVGPARNVMRRLVDQSADLPDWFLIGNDMVREIRLDLPDLEERYVHARGLRSAFAPAPDLPGQGIESVALRTDGEILRNMSAIAALAQSEGHSVAQSGDTLRLFRTGVRRNPWQSPVLPRWVVEGATRLSARVKGQSLAIDRTLDVLARAIMGLSGAQTGQRHGPPRGVLFFAGPTGAGKTDLAKAVTELVFGDVQACHRFDMPAVPWLTFPKR